MSYLLQIRVDVDLDDAIDIANNTHDEMGYEVIIVDAEKGGEVAKVYSDG